MVLRSFLFYNSKKQSNEQEARTYLSVFADLGTRQHPKQGDSHTKSQLRNLYNLDPKTMLKIEAGRKLSPSTHRHYLDTFVCIINNYRCMRYEKEIEMSKVMADILLVECGLKTDSEKQTDYEDERRAEYMKSICSGKI